MSSKDNLRKFAAVLFNLNAVQFGEFKTKLGLMTPIYYDLRVIVSLPKELDVLADLLVEHIKTLPPFDIICGVPYAALPIATLVSVKLNIPMVMRRKEAKNYGTKKLIEGNFAEGCKCLIIEDVVTSGSSILETVKDLNNAGIKCNDSIVLINRQQGGEKILKEHGIAMHALLNTTTLMKYLREADFIDDATDKRISEYLLNTQVDSSLLSKPVQNRLQLSYGDRINHTSNPVVKKLFKIIEAKQTTLCLAADVTKSSELIKLANEAGPHICLLKTHIDILEDFSPDVIADLKKASEVHKFILFEDRKFADIGKTVEYQYNKGTYGISSWAEIVTAHSLMGDGILNAIKQSAGSEERGVFLLAQASAAGNLTDDKYAKATVKMALEHQELVMGVVCQDALFTDNPGLVQLTPGVQVGISGDNLGQHYNSPESVVQRGADVAVVGRGITQAANPRAVAENYKKLLWNAYLKRIQ